MITDVKLQHNRPDIVLVDKKSKRVYFVDVSIPLDSNMQKAYDEKISKYAELSVEIGRVWNAGFPEVLPIIISANGLVHKTVSAHLKRLSLRSCLVVQLQKAAILGTTGIVRRSLSR